MCLDRELNQWTFRLWNDTQTNELHQSGLHFIILVYNKLQPVWKFSFQPPHPLEDQHSPSSFPAPKLGDPKRMLYCGHHVAAATTEEKCLSSNWVSKAEKVPDARENLELDGFWERADSPRSLGRKRGWNAEGCWGCDSHGEATKVSFQELLCSCEKST